MRTKVIEISGAGPHEVISALLSLLGIDILTAGVTLVNGASVRIPAIET